MKKSILFAAMAAMFLCSCGTTKQTPSSSAYNSLLQAGQLEKNVATPTRKERPTEPCEALSWEKDFAAVGTAISHVEKVARNEAIRDARYDLGRMMRVAVEGAAEDYLKNVSVNKENLAETMSEEIDNEFFSECVANSKVIKTTAYDLSDGTIQYYACVEVVAQFDVLEKAAEVAKNVLSRDKSLEVEFDKEQFKGKVKDGLQQYKENRGK